MKKTLLLVTIHGFKGSDNTFNNFPTDLRALLSHTLPKIDVLSVQYPQYETRGDLRECVARFKEWLQNKVIDLEVANRTPSPTVDPSVHVVLIGHSMGGIVAAETLLSIVRDEPVPHSASNNPPSNSTSAAQTPRDDAAVDDDEDSPSSPPVTEQSKLFFPYVQGILAFDTPYLGISPGVLAHGAEEHFNTASTAYKAFNNANKFFGGWNSPRSGSPAPAVDTASRGLPAANESAGGWGQWGKYAMYGGAAAAVAGAAGAAYLNRNQITAGFSWAGSHLEFVGCLARGAELQKRVESIVALTNSHNVGFANFYGALGEEVARKTKYAGAMLGEDRTFCVIPKQSKGKPQHESPTGSKRPAPSGEKPAPKRRKTQTQDDMESEMQEQGAKVQEYAQDTTKSKGKWVKCVNKVATDELKAHTSMFAPKKNPDYYSMSQRARDQIASWIRGGWYESSTSDDSAASKNEGVAADTSQEETQASDGAEEKEEL